MFVLFLLLQLARKATTAQIVLMFVLLTARHVDTWTVCAHVKRVGGVKIAQQVFLNVNKKLVIHDKLISYALVYILIMKLEP